MGGCLARRMGRTPTVTTPPAVSLLGTPTFNTTSGTKTVTATPIAGSLIVIFTAHSGTSGSTAPTDNQGGTYSGPIETATKAAGADIMHAWVRTAFVPSGSSTVFTHAPGATSGGGLTVFAISNMHKTASAAVLQSNHINTGGAVRPSIVFGATPQIANPIFGAIFNGTNPATLAPRTGYTEHFDLGYTTPNSGFQVMSINSGETSATIQWGTGASATAHAGIILEMDAS